MLGIHFSIFEQALISFFYYLSNLFVMNPIPLLCLPDAPLLNNLREKKVYFLSIPLLPQFTTLLLHSNLLPAIEITAKAPLSPLQKLMTSVCSFIQIVI